MTAGKVLSLSTCNKNLVKTQYAVRGKLALRAEELRASGRKVTSCNIGNPQQLKQKPITFFRQVLALVDYPDLMASPILPEDAKARASGLLDEIVSTGSYSHSQGILSIRKHVAEFIERRDGFPANPNHIFLTGGYARACLLTPAFSASPGVQSVLGAIISSSKVGIMIPIPQYPLYSATMSLNNGVTVPYYLAEDQHWSMDVSELSRSLKKARSEGTDVRALCVINPGNPTGQCLSESNIAEIIEFCRAERLVILADEVYQTNIYSDVPFTSFKKVLSSLGHKDVELFSFHSVSKGMIGECGRRGGYFECTGIDQDIIDVLYKRASISLCPPVPGQILVDLMVNPPKEGDPSFPAYQKEVSDIFSSLKSRALKLGKAFNELQGVTCNSAQGALYLFPRIRLPEKAIQEADKQGMPADELYCMELLEATGVCMVAGTGFLQEPGTLHFRSTFLPPEDEIDAFIASVSEFHKSFMGKYQ